MDTSAPALTVAQGCLAHAAATRRVLSSHSVTLLRKRKWPARRNEGKKGTSEHGNDEIG